MAATSCMPSHNWANESKVLKRRNVVFAKVGNPPRMELVVIGGDCGDWWMICHV